jgi:hypothetical protein
MTPRNNATKERAKYREEKHLLSGRSGRVDRGRSGFVCGNDNVAESLTMFLTMCGVRVSDD